MNLTHRKACIDDLKAIVSLLASDQLGQTREQFDDALNQHYIDAFHRINNDPNQFLMVLCEHEKIIGSWLFNSSLEIVCLKASVLMRRNH